MTNKSKFNIRDGKRKIEVVEPNGFKDDGLKRENGDVYWEDLDQAQYYIDLGWAKCVDTDECGERKPGMNTVIKPKNSNNLAK